MVPYQDLARPGTFMNRMLHIAICLAVATHMVFGCCWHHAHAAESFGPQPTAVESRGCGCDHHAAGPHHQTCDHDGHDRTCHEKTCDFTRSDAPEGRDLLVGLQDIAWTMAVPALSSEPWYVTVDWVPSPIATSVPLYLINQVLLI